MLQEREDQPMTSSTTISVPPSCEESGRFSSPFLSAPLSLSLSPTIHEAPLSPIPSQTGCACGAEKDPLGPIQLHPHSTPHPGSQMLPPGLALAGGFSFSPTCHPLSSVVHSMTWHVLISFLSLSLLFFFLTCRLVWSARLRTKITDLHKRNTYTGIIVVYHAYCFFFVLIFLLTVILI